MSELDQTMFAIPTSRSGSATGSASAIDLRRIPERHDPSLRAWDAADEYALAYLAEADLITTRNDGVRPSTLVVNDLFGALAVALAAHRPQSWGDSVTSHHATAANLARNGLTEGTGADSANADPVVTPIPSTENPQGPIDLAVIKVPRSRALLEDQLCRLAPLLTTDAVVVGAGMTKTIHTSTLEMFERHLGPSPTSLARRKARLILPTIDAERVRPTTPSGTDGPTTITSYLANGRPVIDFPNVFSRGKLDLGTATLLNYLDQQGSAPLADDADVLDLGCGNGVLGLSVAEHAAAGTATFVDESYQAIASARATAAAWGLAAEQRFLADHTLDLVADDSIDVVVNNPPFHSHQSRTDSIARTMFDQSRRVLRSSGRLLVVGNRHLGYHRELQRRFTSVTTVAATPKFVVIEARP